MHQIGTKSWMQTFFERIRNRSRMEVINRLHVMGFLQFDSYDEEDLKHIHNYIFQLKYYRRYRIRYSSHVLISSGKLLGTNVVKQLI